jgi:hypothetical protein
MTRPGLHRLLASVALAVGILLPGAIASPIARAASAPQTAPPGINTAQPTVAGKLVAKATGKASSGPVSCGSGTAAPTVMVNRGLVICTDGGSLVLLQLSKSTAIFNRDFRRIGYGALGLGDRLNAWGILRDGGTRLYPTVAIQDLSRGGAHLQTVTGRLVAKPDQGPTGQVICGDQDHTKEAQTALNRGLVICTEEGKLVLLELSGTTKLLTHDRAGVTVEDLRLGDTLTGMGTLQVGGTVMFPTASVVDANLQLRGTNSQDFIAAAGPALTLYVLSSEVGPVQGQVLASPGEPLHIRLCGGAQGSWKDLKAGLTVNVDHSIFNTRTMEYVDTNTVSVVSCA